MVQSAIYTDSQGRNATVKKVAARVDYPFDFDWLVEFEQSEIVSYTVTVNGVTKVADAKVGNVIFVTVEGGYVGQGASISVVVTLDDANRFPLDLILEIK